MSLIFKRLLKITILKFYGVKVDFLSDAWIRNKASRSSLKSISIERSIVSAESVGEGCKFYHCILHGNIKVGRYTSIFGHGTIISSIGASISIGSFCSIGQNVSIQDSNHRIDKISTYFMSRNLFNQDISNDVTSKGNILIEDDVWIGSNTVILSGVTVGRGSVIGAGSIVTKDVPPYSIVTGNPGVVRKKRFSEKTIQILEELEWWKWPIDKIKRNSELFMCNIECNDVVCLKSRVV